ncbi:MAG: stage V sporulation protein AC [Kyrpidia tusciae]|nr:stage V sporulation protein AC [Kyrpidia tusciae]MBE3551330.1 stage V sporulation protein AC [Kyrpidia tusciae]
MSVGTPDDKRLQKEYQMVVKRHRPPVPAARNALRAFVVGGLVCDLGQFIQYLYMRVGGFDREAAANPTAATLVFVAILLTGLGLYDRFAQWAGAGSAVPITGFANAMSSSAIEAKSEGLVLGVGANMFKVAGPVIVFGVVAAFFVTLIRAVLPRIIG